MALLTCAGCGCAEHVELIDAKPSDGDWESGDYDRFLCIACYGSGWEPLSKASLDRSVCGHLEPHYERWRQMDRARAEQTQETLDDLARQAAERAATRLQELPISA